MGGSGGGRGGKAAPEPPPALLPPHGAPLLPKNTEKKPPRGKAEKVPFQKVLFPGAAKLEQFGPMPLFALLIAELAIPGINIFGTIIGKPTAIIMKEFLQ